MADFPCTFIEREVFHVFGTGPGDPPDVTPPTITLVSPAAGSTILPTTEIVIDVTDNMALALMVLTVELPSGGAAHEVVYLRSAFATLYSASSVAPIAGGYRFTVRRTGGWIAAPTFHVEAVDSSGNVG